MSNQHKFLLAFVVPQLAVLVLALALLAVGVSADLCAVVSMMGSFGASLGCLAFIVLIDSRARWPGQNAWQRLVNVLSFTR